MRAFSFLNLEKPDVKVYTVRLQLLQNRTSDGKLDLKVTKSREKEERELWT